MGGRSVSRESTYFKYLTKHQLTVLTILDRYAGMFFNARFHRDSCFEDLCKIPRGYKTPSPEEDGPDNKARKPRILKNKSNVTRNFPSIASPWPTNRLSYSEQERHLELDIYKTPGRDKPGQVPYRTTTVPEISTPTEVQNTRMPCHPENFDGTQGPFGYQGAHLERIGSCFIANKGSDTIISQLSDDSSMNLKKHASPFLAFQSTPTWFLLGSQNSQSDSRDWGCSPPIGIAKRQDILGGPTSIIASSETFYSPARVPQQLTGSNDSNSRCTNIPVQVLFHGASTEISPLVTNFRRYTPSPFRKNCCFSPPSGLAERKVQRCRL